MEETNLSRQQLDALQRVGPSLLAAGSAQASSPLTTTPTVFHVEEIGCDPGSKDLSSGQHASKPSGQGESRRSPLIVPRLCNVLTGAHGARCGVGYVIQATAQQVAFHFAQLALADQPAAPRTVLLRLLRGEFAPLRARRLEHLELAGFTRAGLVLGLPTVPESPVSPGEQPVDRLIRALIGQTWACMVVAVPLEEEVVSQHRGRCLDEIRRTEAATSSAGVSHPLGQRYLSLLGQLMDDLMLGISIGMWRVGVYLLGTDSSFPELAALWRGLHAQGGLTREPIRVIEDQRTLDWARQWSLPSEGTRYPLHPHAYQSLLTSAQLAQLVDLPSNEVLGLGMRRRARFDVTPAKPPSQDASISIGAIQQSGVDLSNYGVKPAALRRHAFIAGVTGAGKTNTLFHLLRQLHTSGTPFLVLEPTKAEYRMLLGDPSLRDQLRIFTVGDERTSPLRLNPFEVVGWPINPVGVHIDLLRSCFSASFGMWTPLPQILEQCLHEIYLDRGWDITTNTNTRLREGDDPSHAFPTMGDLARKVDLYTATLGYDDRVRSDMRAALLTRVKGLRIGAKGRMFETSASLPMETLLRDPTVLELQNLGDDDDKAFLMALLFIRIVEYRRSLPLPAGLSHVLVVEEAHRLLTNVGRSSREEQADPRGKAVEAFSNLIAEIRAYGQGLVVVDQVPTKLAGTW